MKSTSSIPATILPLSVIMRRHEHEKFSTGSESDTILRDDITSIKYRLHELMGYHFDLSDDFRWTPMEHNGDLRGSLAKRIKKQINISDRYELGMEKRYRFDRLIDQIDKAMDNLDIENNSLYDWTFTIDWRSGQFGDSGSCYFPRGGYIDSMERNCVGAIRRWSISKNKGVARAWMAVDQPLKHMITIYNRYGRMNDCLSFCEALSVILKNLGVGEFCYNSVKIKRDGSGHINGDAACMINTALYEPSQLPSSVTVMLKRTEL